MNALFWTSDLGGNLPILLVGGHGTTISVSLLGGYWKVSLSALLRADGKLYGIIVHLLIK